MLILIVTAASYLEAAVNCGYRKLNFIFASAVRNCQLTFAAIELCSHSQADNSSRSSEILSILRDKHCLVIPLSSISAIGETYHFLEIRENILLN